MLIITNRLSEKYRSHYDTTAKNCGPLFLQQVKLNERWFSYLSLDIPRPSLCSQKWLQTICISFFLMASSRWKRALIIVLPKRTVVLYYSAMQKHNQR